MLTTSEPEAEALTEEEKAAASGQLERLLADPHFSHSKRFPSFLRFIVEHTLAGQQDLLKERTIGVEVFGKNAGYDTAIDPIVRVTAAEIRKRIALYYQQPGREDEMRLSLPLGSYVPQFHPPNGHAKIQNEVHEDAVAVVPETPLEQSASSGRSWLIVLVSVLGGILLSVVLFYARRAFNDSPVPAFWAPVLNSPDPALFCVADQTQYTAIDLRDANDPSRQIMLKDNLTAVVIDDLTPLVKFAGILQPSGKKYRVLGEGSTTLTDLRNGPDIFIGAYDNAWTLRLLKPLRFHFNNDSEMSSFSIVDSSPHPSGPWVVDRTQQLATNIYRDYAIVARFTDNNTGRLAIVAAGIGRGGTIAAGEFLTDPVLLQQIKHIPGYDDKKNIELVLSTQIIGGSPGTPHIEAGYAW